MSSNAVRNRYNGVQVISCTFEDLINTRFARIPNSTICGQLCIPEYQRPYVWKEKQINRLLDDFREYFADNDHEKSMFYLGSIILHQDGNKLNIIDGQQRITTLLLMKAVVDDSFVSGLEYCSSKSIDNIKRNYAYLKSITQNDIFDYVDADLLSQINFTEINVTVVVTGTEDLAYTFFETQNTGGIRLSGSDIIKAHHLRAITSGKIVNYQARKWESTDSTNIEAIIQNLTKVRFWDNRKWRRFPFYRDLRSIKNVLIEEFTERTNNDNEDISFYYSAVKNKDGRAMQMYESHIKQLKQPLSDGNNTLDYINDYVQICDALFGKRRDHRVNDAFYDFYASLVHGQNGTIFLKELLEICIVAYVSRFGFFRLFETSLWLFRCIYSLRVTSSRNVREDSVFKFVYAHQLIDNILEVYTVEELLQFLKRFNYEFNTENTEENQSKDKHLSTLKIYFREFSSLKINTIKPKEFDKLLIKAISAKIKDNRDAE
ncbi:DUF262 domain-containing protein [Pedobacter sp.]